jgi:hypothetical protein
MKWPRLAPHSRASLADSLATVTPLLIRETGRRPPAGRLQAGCAPPCTATPSTRSAAPASRTRVRPKRRHGLKRASLPVSQLSDPRVIRAALDGLCVRLDGTSAAANMIIRKRAVFHGALGYPLELGLLPANPLNMVQWRAPRAAGPQALPRRRHPRRPLPPVLVGMLRQHLAESGTAADGRLFRGDRGGMLSESVYGRAWHAARRAALGPDLAAAALARRPYNLRHAALSLWLNARGEPAEVAARAGTSTRVLHDVYVHCISSQEDNVS